MAKIEVFNKPIAVLIWFLIVCAIDDILGVDQPFLFFVKKINIYSGEI